MTNLGDREKMERLLWSASFDRIEAFFRKRWPGGAMDGDMATGVAVGLRTAMRHPEWAQAIVLEDYATMQRPEWCHALIDDLVASCATAIRVSVSDEDTDVD